MIILILIGRVVFVVPARYSFFPFTYWKRSESIRFLQISEKRTLQLELDCYRAMLLTLDWLGEVDRRKNNQKRYAGSRMLATLIRQAFGLNRHSSHCRCTWSCCNQQCGCIPRLYYLKWSIKWTKATSPELMNLLKSSSRAC